MPDASSLADSAGTLAASDPASPGAPEPRAPGPAARASDPAAPAPVVQGDGTRIRRRDLLNLLNLVNFLEGVVWLNFRRRDGGPDLSVRAFPLPCGDELLTCRWTPRGAAPRGLEARDFDFLLLADGHSQVTVRAELLRLDEEGAELRIPESGWERGFRSMERHPCEGVEARILQSGIAWDGRLLDFNAGSFRVELDRPAGGSLRWINAEARVSALLSRGGALLYSGDCAIARMDRGDARRELVLVPSSEGVRRYRSREFRGQRQVLSPSPAARFVHPLTGKPVYLQVEDVSGAGICVEEFFDRAFLLPGMVIPSLELEIANRSVLRCRAQVLYSNVARAGETRSAVRCGIVFLDMEAKDQARLSALIHQSLDDRLRVCGAVDMEELWRFFFESGFIYPSKYRSIEAHKEDFKRTYERLYLESPTIARHFLFRDRGQLFGHMSMIRYYPDSWIIHHHAASRSGYGMAGVKVLDEVGRFGNDFYHHPASRIDYLMCYYRKENRFPARVFGNVERDIGDRKGSSTDAFAYLRIPEGGDEASFQLFPARAEDLEEAARRYDALSGGLALEALGLSPSSDPEEDRALSAEYARQGFRRERQVYRLGREGRLQALLAVSLSDIGLNLSNLTNCLHAFVLDPSLAPATLFAGLRAILGRRDPADLPVLAFPADYLDGHSIPYDKKYLLWVLDMDRADAYFASVRNTFRRVCGDGDGNGERG